MDLVPQFSTYQVENSVKTIEECFFYIFTLAFFEFHFSIGEILKILSKFFSTIFELLQNLKSQMWNRNSKKAKVKL